MTAVAQPRPGQAFLALALIPLLAFSLRVYDLSGTGQNLYYAAAVRSMLDAWHNFVFASFDPGGSLTIDKPPLGFSNVIPSLEGAMTEGAMTGGAMAGMANRGRRYFFHLLEPVPVRYQVGLRFSLVEGHSQSDRFTRSTRFK